MKYDRKKLIDYIEMWSSMGDKGGGTASGYSSCAPIHRMASSNRQWDAESSLIDSQLDRDICRIVGVALLNLSIRGRAMVIGTYCNARLGWSAEVIANIPRIERTQVLDDAMQKIADEVQGNGLEL